MHNSCSHVNEGGKPKLRRMSSEGLSVLTPAMKALCDETLKWGVVWKGFVVQQDQKSTDWWLQYSKIVGGICDAISKLTVLDDSTLLRVAVRVREANRFLKQKD